MLKLNPNPVLSADVKITIPGEKDPGIMKLTFSYLPKKEWTSLFKSLIADVAKDGTVMRPSIPEDDVVAKLVTGWEGMDVEFSAENLGTFLDNYPAAAWEIIGAYNKLVLESRVKN